MLGRERFGAWGYLRFLHNRKARSYPIGFDQHILVGLFRGVIAKIVELVDEDRRTFFHRKGTDTKGIMRKHGSLLLKLFTYGPMGSRKSRKLGKHVLQNIFNIF